MTRLLTAAIMGLTAAAAMAAEPAEDYPGWNAGIAATFADYSFSSGAVDDNTAGVKIFSGYRFDKWFGVEGAYHNFGQFGDDTDPTQSGGDAKVDVSGFSLTGVVYAPIPNPDLDIFARLGYYDFNQDLKVDSVPTQSQHIDGLVAGAGVRMKVSDQIRVRAEGEYFDVDNGDLWALNLGIEYLFGGPKAVPAAAVAAAAPPPPPPPPVVVAAPRDSDGDGVLDGTDQCPDTPAGAKVDATGCEQELILRGVTFPFNSATLTPQDELILNSVADILKKRPQFRVEVRGHTDNRGSEAYNLSLSQRRADSVRDYLVAQGVGAEKLTAVGMGAADPVASNDTDAGREQNRRVSLEFNK